MLCVTTATGLVCKRKGGNTFPSRCVKETLAVLPVRPKQDGKFHTIKVRVKRPGVQVRARRGYLAATQADMAAIAASEAPVDPAVRVREGALATLETTSRDRPVS